MNKRDKIFTIALALIVVALLIATPRHPIAAWKGPCYVFCVLTLAWLAPDLWAMVPRKRGASTNSHEFKKRSKDEKI
jgi:hypothetical protein